jgi:hypothetical protein
LILLMENPLGADTIQSVTGAVAARQMTEFMSRLIFQDGFGDEDHVPVHETGMPPRFSDKLVHSGRELTRDLLCIDFLR